MSSIILSVFSCVSCRSSAEWRSFPLCEDCLRSRIDSRALCSTCGSPLCLLSRASTCRHPWISLAPLAAIHARYVLSGQWYEVLKRWKVAGGPLLSRRVLLHDEGTRDYVAHRNPEALIPIPHAPSRAWELGGSPSLRLAMTLRDWTRVPVMQALIPASETQKKSAHQARREFRSRFGAKGRFGISASHADWIARAKPKLMLVDDFFTTGQTLKDAASELLASGASEVSAYVLGIRPNRSQGAESENQISASEPRCASLA